MPLEKQNLTLSFGQGLDTKTDSKQLPPGKLTVLENGVLKTPKEIRKRYGNLAYPQTVDGSGSPPAISSGVSLAPFLNELGLSDGQNFYSLNQSSSKWINKGAFVPCEVTSYSVIKNTYSQTTQDMAVSGTTALFTWEDSSGGSRYSFVDTKTNQVVVNSQLISSTAIKPKAIVAGSNFVILYVDTSTNNLCLLPIPTSTVFSPGSIVVGPAIGNGGVYNYDACVMGNYFYVAFNYYAGGNELVVQSFESINYNVGTQYVISGENPSGCITIFPDYNGNYLWIAYANTTQVKYLVVNATTMSTEILAPTVIDTQTNVRNITGLSSANSSGTVFYELQGSVIQSPNPNSYVRSSGALNTSGTGISPSTLLRSVGLAAKCFTYSGTTYIPLAHDSSTQPTYFIANSSGTIVAKIASQVAGGLTKKSILAEVSVSGAIVTVPLLEQDFLTTGTSGTTTKIFTQSGVVSCSVNFSSSNLGQSVSLGNNLHLGGGFLSMYDGASVVEHGFHLYPEQPTAIMYPMAGAMDPGQYQYQEVFEWTDNQGNLHQSNPSVAATATTPSTIVIVGSGSDSSANITGISVLKGSQSGIYPGMAVSGTGISSGTYITDIITSPSYELTLSQNPTSVGGLTLTLTPQSQATGTQSSPSSAALNLGTVKYLSYPGNTISGQPTLTLFGSIQGLVVGQTVFTPTGIFAGGTTITAITGNTLTLSSNATATTFGAMFNFMNSFTCSTTTSSSTITNLPSWVLPLLFTGNYGIISVSTVSSGALTGIASISGNSISLYGSGASSTTSSATGILYFKSAVQLLPYQNISGTGIPIGTTIQSLDTSANVAYLSQTPQWGQGGASAGTSFPFTSQSVYGVNLSLPTLRLTAKKSSRAPVYLNVYRTAANQTTFRELVSPLPSTTNDATQDSITQFDSASDNSMLSNAQLYTTGGVLENISPPAATLITKYQNRIFLVPSESPQTVWPSKEVQQGYPVTFNDSLELLIDNRGGNITAFAQLDGNLIIFKENAIFYFNGQGPTNTGANSDYTNAQLITSDCGCIRSQSLVLQPNGLMFQSNKGIYLLDRALQVSYIGADVETYNPPGYYVTGAVLIADKNQVRFTLTNGTGSAPPVLVYDYYFRQWSTFTGINSNASGAAHCQMFNDVCTYLLPSGQVLYESSTTFGDNGNAVVMKLQLGWISFASVQGYGRLYDIFVLGDWKSSHTLNVQLAYDFNSSVVQADAIPATSNIEPYQFRIRPATQKCEAIQVTIYDSPSANTDTFDISSIAFRVGVKPGLKRLPASQQYG